MGLDIFFYRTSKKNYEEFKSNKNEESTEDVKNKTEVAYFRKVNFLMSFFNYTGNCEYMEITESEIKQLIDSCGKVLNERNEETSSELLPAQMGFFFGNYEYNDWYYENVEQVLTDFTKILNETDFNEQTILMFCWW